MYFSLSKIPNTILHWSLSFHNDSVTEIISRDRWTKIKSNIHLTDNKNVDPDDTLYKIRPLVDQLQKEFGKIPMQENLCIDEQMDPFKGKSWLKQYIPKKLHKWGYKFFLLCDSFEAWRPRNNGRVNKQRAISLKADALTCETYLIRFLSFTACACTYV